MTTGRGGGGGTFLVSQVVPQKVISLAFVVEEGNIEIPGMKKNPFLLRNFEDLNKLASVVNTKETYGNGVVYRYSEAHYKLVNDITFKSMSKAETTNFTPIGKQGGESRGAPFMGVFNGNGKTITGLTYTGYLSELGFFGYVSNASISNLGLNNVNITNRGPNTGAFAGVSSNSEFANVAVFRGSVKGFLNNVGGMVGVNDHSRIRSSFSRAVVTGNGANVGGLIGINVSGDVGEDALVSYSYALGHVIGMGDNVGGLIGQNKSLVGGGHAKVTQVFAKGAVTGDARNVGGLIGWNVGSARSGHASVTSGYATGVVTGAGVNTGGLIGWNKGHAITISFAAGNVSGKDTVGGLIGREEGRVIISAYASGDVLASRNNAGGLIGIYKGQTLKATYATGTVKGNMHVGGLIGMQASGEVMGSYTRSRVIGNDLSGGLVGKGGRSGIVSLSYWDRDIWDEASTYGSGQSAGLLKNTAAYKNIYARWDVDLNSDGRVDMLWDFGSSEQYPVLLYLPISVEGQRKNTAR